VNSLDSLIDRKETIWINQNLEHTEPMSVISGGKFLNVRAAQSRLMRFFPYIEKAFPETAEKKGLIESELIKLDGFGGFLKSEGLDLARRVFLKDDAHLPIAGSVKARGGIHEVLKLAEDLLRKAKLIKPTDNYSLIDSEECRNYLGRYTVQVGSTGNLGLSIGIISAKLGFKVIVHMSMDAKEWKKGLLRKNKVEVITYEGDYSLAVKSGRERSSLDPFSYFVDDENSEQLFYGYATAALRLKMQLMKQKIVVDREHPLFVYIPCGVGGAPSGITYGLKQMFGDYVHCFFAEPVEMPSFMLGMIKGRAASVSELGLGGETIADGLACGKASEFSLRMMRYILSGVITVNDEELSRYQKVFYDFEDIYLEPSAVAGACAMRRLLGSEEYKEYISENDVNENNISHIIWATGGGLVPEEIRRAELGI